MKDKTHTDKDLNYGLEKTCKLQHKRYKQLGIQLQKVIRSVM